MKVLIACEESQRVCIEMRKLGHEAYSCDILPTTGGHPEWHVQGDCIPLINGNCNFKTQDGVQHTIEGAWDLLIAHPPCTYLSNAGACRLYPHKGQLNKERYELGLQAKSFFMSFLNADCPRIVVENPVPSKIFDLPSHSQEIQPYQFDEFGEHPYTKKTRLWFCGDIKPLVPTTPDEKPIGPYCPAGTGRKNRDKYGAAKRGDDAKNRAKTFHGIAKAMADQWAGECK